MMRKCPDCQTPIDEQAAFCDNCGLPLSEASKAAVAGLSQPKTAIKREEPPPPVPASVGVLNAAAGTCSACGFQNVPGELFCQNCGVQLAPVASSPPPPPTPVQGPAPDHSAAAHQPATGGVCPHCGHKNQPGKPFCENCGVELGAAEEPDRPTSPSASIASVPTRPQESDQAGAAIGRLVVQESGTEIQLPPGRTDLLLGRADPARQVYPDIDLTPHGGERGGVSRVHARLLIRGRQISIEDLNSTNYTFVNNQKLQPEKPHPLDDGDEVRLGLFVMHFFET